MIPQWNVTALIVGWSMGDTSGVLYRTDQGTPTTSPIIAVALECGIEGKTHRVLVDTGFHDADWVTEHVIASTQSEDEKIENALKNGPGWTPDQVDIVINTHLHYDHCGNNALFRNAAFVTSRTEWEYGLHPTESQAFGYLQELFDYRSVNYLNWQFTEGETEILPGLLVFPTPGHTPGHISVLVNTEDDGVVCIAGDQCNRIRNIRENIINGLFSDPIQAMESFEEIRKRCNSMIPGHDPVVKMFQTKDFPRIRD